MKDFSQTVQALCDNHIRPVNDTDDFSDFEMRPMDYKETSASSGLESPTDIVQECIKQSDYSWVIEIGGQIVGVFGLTNIKVWKDCGCPWLIGTPELNTLSPLQFVRYSKVMIKVFHTKYKILTNIVLAEYESAVRWLELIGFEMDKELSLEVGGEKFYHFKKGIK